MKKIIEVCDECEIESYETILYECTKCRNKYCEECILDHLVKEGLIIKTETD